MRRTHIVGVVLILLTQAAVAQTNAPSTGEVPRYVPPNVGAPPTRVAASSRGTEACLTHVDVLAPLQTGLAGAREPTVWWHLARDCGHPVEITLIDATSFAADPVLEQRLAPPPAGFHSVTLPAGLDPDVEYRFSVAVIVDETSRSADVFAAATLRHAAVPSSAEQGDATALAAAGLWYDALDAVMRAERRGTDPLAGTARTALLEQVGLSASAASTHPVHAP